MFMQAIIPRRLNGHGIYSGRSRVTNRDGIEVLTHFSNTPHMLFGSNYYCLLLI